jgi:hypothetical protein
MLLALANGLTFLVALPAYQQSINNDASRVCMQLIGSLEELE